MVVQSSRAQSEPFVSLRAHILLAFVWEFCSLPNAHSASVQHKSPHPTPPNNTVCLSSIAGKESRPKSLCFPVSSAAGRGSKAA